MSDSSRARCVVLGLDGASPDLIRKFAKEGHLPNLSRLMQNGCFGRLESTFPPMSPSAWTSFMTGKNPGRHGVFDFTQRLTGTYRVHITSRSDQPTLWGILSAQGRRVAVFNVPQTYPVEPVNGIMVTGLGTPVGRPFSHPDTMGLELLRQGYHVDADLHFREGAEHEFLKASFETTLRNSALIQPYLQSVDWDFAMVVLRLTDEVPHFFWKYMDPDHPAYAPRPEFATAVLDCYKIADQVVGALTELAGDATTVVMSDHGFGPLYRDVYLNEWLRREGFLAVHGRATGSARLFRLLQRIGFTRVGIGRLLTRLGLSRWRGALRSALGARATLIPNDEKQRLAEMVDWGATRAYSMGYIGQVFVNLKGREPQGIVEPGAEYEQVRAELTDSLLRMTDPDDGQPVVDRVVRREEVYRGPYAADAPDLFVIMRDFSYITRESYEWSESGRYIAPPPTLECAGHRPDGVLIMSGPGVRIAGGEMDGAKIIDLAPTILHLLGMPVPEDMDGRVLTDWLSPAIQARAVQYIGTTQTVENNSDRQLTEDDEKNLYERLKSLGYVD